MTSKLEKLAVELLPTERAATLIVRCIEEDGGLLGDVTSHSIFKGGDKGTFNFVVRGEGILSGLEPIMRGVANFSGVEMVQQVQDGSKVHNQVIATISGSLKLILVLERSILNLLSHASGIATRTSKFVEAVQGTNCNICDTRKTTPGLRHLDKYAVACGGGMLHRIGLDDAALYKDNHLCQLDDLESDLANAIQIAKEQQLKFVEVEVDSIDQLKKVLPLEVDMILLDNMTLEQLQESVTLRNQLNPAIQLEASGGVTLETVRSIAETGVDRIAIGSLTHQATWLDIGLDACHE